MFELKDATTGEPMFEQIAITLVLGPADPHATPTPALQVEKIGLPTQAISTLA